MGDLRFVPRAWDDYVWWQSQDRRTLRKINALLAECIRTPFEGTGKVEALRGDLSGYWSRRIDQHHRLVYTVDADGIVIVASCRDHYE
jgi:toxin YoeB